jgi:hypothetical protein
MEVKKGHEVLKLRDDALRYADCPVLIVVAEGVDRSITGLRDGKEAVKFGLGRQSSENPRHRFFVF